MKIKLNMSSIFGFDFILFASIQVLMVIGVFFIYSSGVNSNGTVVSDEYIKQIVWVISGNIILLTVSFMDYRILKNIAFWLYLFMLLILLLTAGFGQVVNGSKSWLGIGSLGIQPSELSKLVTILFLSLYLENNRKSIDTLQVFIIGFIIVCLPMGLILMQPDLGTAMVFIPVFLIMMFIAGGRARYIIMLTATGLLTIFFSMLPFYLMYMAKTTGNSVILFTEQNIMTVISLTLAAVAIISVLGYLFTRRSYFYYLSAIFSITGLSYFFSFFARKILKEYQVMRLIVFLDPQVDPRGSGWNIIQSVTAVGSGGAFGKGYLQGTQSHYRYLPEQSTDFIFSIISEEIGFMGNLLIIVLFVLIFWRCINIILKSQDLFGSLIAAGIVGMIFFHFMINIGMAIGIMPITGIPLVFLSYGGSSLWTTMLGIGILLSVYHRRYKNVN
ncbi:MULTISPECIES: rod shape-determining protein RodA [unclassified Oceanispirochaeta]|uniref:rod shape-determining protein RodA n=1 Tax=unclassified Oceanispirochaeta TaxID=2635722 RepID=UPI001E37E7FF|nr:MULTISPECIES: rod shape-determining protein RodA [unclassified Oceanispirochaeta]